MALAVAAVTLLGGTTQPVDSSRPAAFPSSIPAATAAATSSQPPHFTITTGHDPNSLAPPPAPPPPITQTVEEAQAWLKADFQARYGSARTHWHGCSGKEPLTRIPAWQAQYNALYCLIAGESRWYPAAVNKHSGACGLGQINPCRKMSASLPDWPARPLDQLRLFILPRIERTYGGFPTWAQSHRCRTGWW